MFLSGCYYDFGPSFVVDRQDKKILKCCLVYLPLLPYVKDEMSLQRKCAARVALLPGLEDGEAESSKGQACMRHEVFEVSVCQ